MISNHKHLSGLGHLHFGERTRENHAQETYSRGLAVIFEQKSIGPAMLFEVGDHVTCLAIIQYRISEMKYRLYRLDE